MHDWTLGIVAQKAMDHSSEMRHRLKTERTRFFGKILPVREFRFCTYLYRNRFQGNARSDPKKDAIRHRLRTAVMHRHQAWHAGSPER